MTRQEAMQHARYVRELSKDCSMIALDADVIDALLSDPWHKASEELPKENGLYIARFEKAEGGFFIDIFDFCDGYFMDWRAIEGKYTHWMEIPEIKED